MPRIEGIEEMELRCLHDDEGMSQPSLAEYFNVSRQVIRSRMIEYGIKAHSISEAKTGRSVPARRVYNINEEFFEMWIPESAWAYGWILGDGNYTDSIRIRLWLSAKDEEVLYKIRDVFNSEHPIKRVTRNGRDYSYILFNSVKLVRDISSLNYIDVPEVYFSDFLRGFFEAEGCVDFNNNTIRTTITQNDYDILDFIYWCLHDFKIVNGGSLYQHGNGWNLSFSKYDSISLYHYMYDDCGDMFLARKKERFEEIMEKI